MAADELEPDEDLPVALVEQALSVAGARTDSLTESTTGRETAVHALWTSACITLEDSPTWLIYDREDDDLAWRRVPPSIEPSSLVDAQLSAGGHADPAVVLRWVAGRAVDLWATIGSGVGDGVVITELGRKIQRA